MRITLAIFASVFAVGCAATQQSDADLRAAADAIDQAAVEFESQMSADERAAFHREVEASAIAEMQAVATACGTNLQFSNEPKFEDRSVFVEATATPQALACVRKSYPFVKALPE